VAEEQVLTIVYPEGFPHFVRGRFVQFGAGDRLSGTALLEMYEGDNRLVIDHGASGAPVVDCDGRVAAVISDVFTQSLAVAVPPDTNFDGLGNSQRRLGADPGVGGYCSTPIGREHGRAQRAAPHLADSRAPYDPGQIGAATRLGPPVYAAAAARAEPDSKSASQQRRNVAEGDSPNNVR